MVVQNKSSKGERLPSGEEGEIPSTQDGRGAILQKVTSTRQGKKKPKPKEPVRRSTKFRGRSYGRSRSAQKLLHWVKERNQPGGSRGED